jgi:hypothetical protein
MGIVMSRRTRHVEVNFRGAGDGLWKSNEAGVERRGATRTDAKATLREPERGELGELRFGWGCKSGSWAAALQNGEGASVD